MDVWDLRERIDALRAEVKSELGRIERAARAGEPIDLQWYRAMSIVDGHLHSASAVARAMSEADRWTTTEAVRRG